MSDKLFPSRPNPFARNLERTMSEGVDLDGCRTVIRDTPDGQAMLRTRGGHPEFSLTKKERKAMPSCIRAPLTETDYADRTYYAETTIRSTCGSFSIEVKYLRSISFLDADGKKVAFVLSSPVGNAQMISGYDVVFVERPFDEREHHPSVLIDPMALGASTGTDALGNEHVLSYHWDGVVYEKKAIKSMQFKVNDVLNVRYVFEQESATGASSYPADEHACMARDLDEIPLSRLTFDTEGGDVQPLKKVRMQYQGHAKYGEIILKPPGGFLQLVSTDFTVATKLGLQFGLADLGIFGHYLHGVARVWMETVDGAIVERQEIVLHDGSVRALPSSTRYGAVSQTTWRGGCYLSRKPGGMPEVFRSGLDGADDVRERRQWLNYALSCQTRGALSGVAQIDNGTGSTAWVYHDQTGGSCFISIAGALVFSGASIYIAAAPGNHFYKTSYSQPFDILNAPMMYAMDPGALVVAARTEDGGRTIFTSYEASDRTVYEDYKRACPNAADFYELVISGTVDLDANQCGLTFAFRRMPEADRTYYNRKKRDRAEGGSGVNESVTRMTHKLGCYFSEGEVVWVETATRVEEVTRIEVVYTPNGSSYDSTTTSVFRREAAIELKIGGEVVASKGHEAAETTYDFDTGVHPSSISDYHSDVVDDNPANASAYRNRVNAYPYQDPPVLEWYVPVTYSPQVFGLATMFGISAAYRNMTGVTFHGFFYPNGKDIRDVQGVLVNDSEESYYTYDPSQNNLFATWNPATGQLHTDDKRCCWI